MKDSSQFTLYKHDAGGNSSNNNNVIIVLGFFGIFKIFSILKNEFIAKKMLAKKYGHLGEKFKTDIMGITFPWMFMFAEKRMRQWVEDRLNGYFDDNPEKKSIILLVSSGGGTVMYSHFLKWLGKKGNLDLKGIMWEYSPGSISISEFFRATSTTLNPKNNSLLNIILHPLLYPPIAISCKACDLVTDYADRVRNAPWSPELIPETVGVEYSIANYNDTVMYYSYVLRWVKEMKSAGRKINHHVFIEKGHLNAMRVCPEKYLEVWDQFMGEALAV